MSLRRARSLGTLLSAGWLAGWHVEKAGGRAGICVHWIPRSRTVVFAGLRIRTYYCATRLCGHAKHVRCIRAAGRTDSGVAD